MTKLIWTVGHSTYPFEKFLEILQSFQIEILADVRSYPGSRRYPQFNKQTLSENLERNHIQYFHVSKLGGRRSANKDSKNLAWKNPAFRAYADYMETQEFKLGIDELTLLAEDKRTAIMCAESLWWKCHRSLISDFLKVNGWTVQHIADVNKSEEHPYTKPARIIDAKLDYTLGD